MTRKQRIVDFIKSRDCGVTLDEVVCEVGGSREVVRRQLSLLAAEGKLYKSGALYFFTEDSLKESEEVRRLKRAVERITKRTINIKYPHDRLKFGVLSDTHIGSIYADIEFLNYAYEVFRNENIEYVFHCGDLVDGEKMYRGQEYEIIEHGADKQIQCVVDTYPRVEGIKTYFILGNHDLSFWKTSGVNIGLRISALRDDMIYLGFTEADFTICDKIIVRLFHPGMGTAYAISYQVQKYIDSLSVGHEPDILLIGHLHKSEYLFYSNIHAIQVGCLQFQTPKMREMRNAAMTGFWVCEIGIDDDSVAYMAPRFYPDYT